MHFGFCETWKGSEYETHEDVGRDGLAKFQIMALISRITRGETSPQPFPTLIYLLFQFHALQFLEGIQFDPLGF